MDGRWFPRSFAVVAAGGWLVGDLHPHLSVKSTYVYYVLMANKTISVPDDVVPIIDSLGMPFSRWVTEQLRRHAARSTVSFAQQIIADAALAGNEAGGERRPSRSDARAAGERMERSAPW